MWVIIMTFAMLSAVSYLIYFERHVRSSAARHLAAAVIADRRSAARRVRLLSDVVRRTSSRMLAITVVTAVFIVSWYPLQILTVIDPGLRHPLKVSVQLSMFLLSPILSPVLGISSNPFLLWLC